MLGLITDRTQENVDYLASLNRKGWEKMTPYERAIWAGDPLTASDFGYREPVNLLPNQVHGSSGVSVLFRSRYFTVSDSGTATIIIGAADTFVGKTVTLSAEGISSGHLDLVWYNLDDDSYEDIGCSLVMDSVTTIIGANPQGKEHLAMIIYARGNTTYSGVMLEFGNTRHEYVPYTPVLPTMATKGAYNYSDLNRVERAVEEISERWNRYLETKTDWTMWDVPTTTDMSRIKGNLAVIGIAAFGRDVLADIPDDLSKMTYIHANRIEELLLSVSAMKVISEV